jgi:hypothetical protein
VFRSHVVLALAATLLVVPGASADEEVAPHSLVFSAPSGHYYLRLDPSPDRDERKSVGRMYRVAAGADNLLYESLAWFSFSELVANDGVHFVRTGPWPGFDSAPEETPALVFYENCMPVKTYVVSVLIEDLSNLQYSVSHYTWGDEPHWTDDPRDYILQVTTVEDRVIRFDIRTAEIIEE